MSVYVELHFHRVGPLAHQTAVAGLSGLTGVEVLFDHTTRLGPLQRQKLWVDEWACRVLLYIGSTMEVEARDREANTRDPYRTIEFEDIVVEIPTALAEAMRALQADHRRVRWGWVRFATRNYEGHVREQFAADVREAVGEKARVELDGSSGRLQGRVEASIPQIHDLVRLLRRCGLVDADQIRIGYDG